MLASCPGQLIREVYNQEDGHIPHIASLMLLLERCE